MENDQKERMKIALIAFEILDADYNPEDFVDLDDHLIGNATMTGVIVPNEDTGDGMWENAKELVANAPHAIGAIRRSARGRK